MITRRIVNYLLIAVAFGLVMAPFVFSRHTQNQTLVIGRAKYNLEVANSDASRQLGLGNRTQLPADSGMLFTGTPTQQQCYWMKDMHFALDIIWLDASKKVTHIEQNLSPSSYPQTYCSPAKDIIELNAGTIARAHIKLGQTLRY